MCMAVTGDLWLTELYRVGVSPRSSVDGSPRSVAVTAGRCVSSAAVAETKLRDK